jgi:L-iditol 2-dehydrogenase
MRAAVQTGPGRMEIGEVPSPEPGPGEIVVSVRAALTCGTDLKLLDRGHALFEPPLVMGHEFAGDVAMAGPGAPAREGDAVMCGLSGPCGACAECRRGSSNLCVDPRREMAWGAFAPLIRIPARVAAQNVFPKPSSLPYEHAALLDPLACVAHGIGRLPLAPGADATVVGVGAIGLLWILALRRSGISAIRAVGRGDARLELARKFGAEPYAAGGPAPPRSRLVVECVGTPSAWGDAFELASPGGSVLFFGGCAPGSKFSLDARRLHYEEIAVAGCFHYRPEDAAEARRWLAAGEIPAAALISGEGGLEDLPALFDAMRRKAGLKYAVRP